MSNLKELQDSLFETIMKNDLSFASIKQNNGIAIADRLEVHRDTILENFISSLKITYPGVWKLIGEDCARGASLAYSHDLNHLQNRENMNNFGDRFPEFLRSFESTHHIDYLSDFAILEWIRSRSYESPNENSVSIQVMQELFINSDGTGNLILNSSIYFLKSKFPLCNIQKLLDDTAMERLNLDNSISYIVVCRVQGRVETLYLSKHQWQFLYNLNNGDAINKAIECFSDEEMEMELSIMIRLLLSKQMVKKIGKEEFYD